MNGQKFIQLNSNAVGFWEFRSKWDINCLCVCVSWDAGKNEECTEYAEADAEWNT